jgi:hypothetical protein
MDKMSLSQLWNKHADHAILADQGYGSGAGSMTHNSKAAKAIEKHVGKHYGNEVAKDMVDHSEHSLAADEYAGPEEAPMHKAAMKKLKTKHNISEAANAAQQAAIAINMKKKGIKPKDEDSYLGMSERKKSFSALKKEMLGKDGMTSEENNNEE